MVGYRRILEEEGEGEDLEGDEELMMGQVQRSLVCPLTQKELENPVKNTACGHVYSKEGKNNLLLLYIFYTFVLQLCWLMCVPAHPVEQSVQ